MNGMTYAAFSFATAVLASTAFISLAALPQPAISQTQESTDMKALKPAAMGYAESAEGLSVYHEVYGQGEPIVVMAGGLMDISTMTQTIVPLSRSRKVIGIDLEGHGRTALRNTPMSHERNGDDVAAVLSRDLLAVLGWW